MFVLFFSYLWRLRVWVFKEYIQNGFVFFRLNREYKSRFQQFTARWQLLFFFSYLIQVEKNKTKKLWGKKNNAPTAGTIASTGLRCPGVGPFQCRMTLRSDAVSQSFGSVVEPKRLGFRLLF
ncbi:hypothetical protein OUZ56_017685 [Daphnia magna]|uniref:Secreted protein n=1 Tax=Daphnia magna TaxID=35525 RepID=A0ABR0ATM3_9CRUS|nr:hypothetical protein OUZ56_017685 [Daphnia magna]